MRIDSPDQRQIGLPLSQRHIHTTGCLDVSEPLVGFSFASRLFYVCESNTITHGLVGYGLTHIHPTTARRFLAARNAVCPLHPTLAIGHVEYGTSAGVVQPRHLASCAVLEIIWSTDDDDDDDDMSDPAVKISALAVRDSLPVDPLDLQDHLIKAAVNAAGAMGVIMVQTEHEFRAARGWHVSSDGIYMTTISVPEIHLQPQYPVEEIRLWPLSAGDHSMRIV